MGGKVRESPIVVVGGGGGEGGVWAVKPAAVGGGIV